MSWTIGSCDREAKYTNEGNHGEDVKEYYFYLDNTPTHSYMKYLYKYPQLEYPYARLVAASRHRDRRDQEYELLDTGLFDDNRYFDVVVEYAKADTEDILIRITVTNRGAETANLRVLPTIWFRNTWSWGHKRRPELLEKRPAPDPVIELNHGLPGNRWLHCKGFPELLFTENETNYRALFGLDTPSPYVKDSIHDYVVHGCERAVNPRHVGTKAAAHYRLTVDPGAEIVLRLRLADSEFRGTSAFEGFDWIFALRQHEADEFYATVIPQDLSADAKNVMRQGLAGMLWSKQFYHYVVKEWLDGDAGHPSPSEGRKKGRNHNWTHLHNADIISMPDKWEYPWYAAWDLAFHCIPLALVDAGFAKEQLLLMLREWYMHPNGQIPAYEWALGDVNPPVHAWAVWRVYKIDERQQGKGDRGFLQCAFHKLMLNFTWWVNRKDADGRNIFQGGFLGLDNIGLFDRSAPLPTGGYIEQSDGTSWMAMYTLEMLTIALELAKDDHCYEDIACKFCEHFIRIAHAMSHRGNDSIGLWNDEDGFFYDVLRLPDGSQVPMRTRSMVGLIPLFAVQTLEPDDLHHLPEFSRRLEWFIDNCPELTSGMASMRAEGMSDRRLLSIADPKQLRQILTYMLDEREFLSRYGIRSLSKSHLEQPFCLAVNGSNHCIAYDPAESTSGVFGGNSNWRGPIWFPLNYLLIESLQRFHHYLGDGYKVEFPTGSGEMKTLEEIAGDLSRRMTSIFLRDENGRRPLYGSVKKFQSDPHWRDLLLFHEYFHGDSGVGLGASHQTGWTGLVVKLLQQSGESKISKNGNTTAGLAFAD